MDFCLTAAKFLAANQEHGMTKLNCRAHSQAFKAKVVLVAIKGKEKLVELA